MNKKGYIKTMEAVVAILLIVVTSYLLIPVRDQPSEVPSVVQGSQRFIGREIELNESIRSVLLRCQSKSMSGGWDYELQQATEDISELIALNKPFGYDFTCAICNNPSTCILDTPLEKSVYLNDVFLSSSNDCTFYGPYVGQCSPKIVRIWFWQAPTDAKYLDDPLYLLPAYNNCTLHSTTCF